MKLEKIYDKTFDWIIDHGPNIILGIIIFFVGLRVIKVISRWFSHSMKRREFDPSLKLFLESLILIALRLVLVLAVMQIIGIQMTIFAAMVGSFGVAAGLALSGTLQNFASGVLILLLKPFEVGDNIITQGQEGTVTSIQIFYTIVTTYDNKTIIVPNSKLSNEVIINVSRIGNRRLDIELKFNYGVDLDKVKILIDQLVENSEVALKEPKYRFGISTVDADGYKVMINVWVHAQDFENTKLEFQERLIEELRKSEIKLPGM